MRRKEILILILVFTAVAFLSCSKDNAPVDTPPDSNTPLTGSPEARSDHGMTYDNIAKRVLLFGGSGSVYFNDLWSYNGTKWDKLSSNGPSARDDASLAYDQQRQKLILWGGRNNSIVYRQLWEWDEQGWNLVSSSGPPARLHAALCYDKTSQKTILFGGADDDGALTDTWLWNGQSWTLADTSGPPHRAVNGLVYYEPLQKVIMICTDLLDGPGSDRTYKSDLWGWNGASWIKISDAPSVSPVQHFSLYENNILLFDGGTAQGNAGITWVWDGNAWSRYNGTGPSARNGHNMAYDSDRKKTVLFGGWNAQVNYNDTWEWDGKWTKR